MRTNNSHKYDSFKSSGRYTGNGFIPSKQARKSTGGCLGSLLIILLPAMGLVVYSVLQAV